MPPSKGASFLGAAKKEEGGGRDYSRDEENRPKAVGPHILSLQSIA